MELCLSFKKREKKNISWWKKMLMLNKTQSFFNFIADISSQIHFKTYTWSPDGPAAASSTCTTFLNVFQNNASMNKMSCHLKSIPNIKLIRKKIWAAFEEYHLDTFNNANPTFTFKITSIMMRFIGYNCMASLNKELQCSCHLYSKQNC